MSESSLARKLSVHRLLLCSLLIAIAGGATSLAQFRSYAPVPGRGQKVSQVGDDFEEKEWEYYPNTPKSSTNLDGQDRQPGGISKNYRVYESTYRGQPDIVRLIDTPPGGIPGSKKSLYMRSRDTGVPGVITRKQQQDDLLINVSSTVGPVSVTSTPSVLVRVYLPPFEYWERRTGTTFGFRAELEGGSYQFVNSSGRGLFSRIGGRSIRKEEAYWPGMFIQFNSRSDGVNKEDSATILIRAGERGEDVVGPTIKQTGWWTLGMSFTSDGMVHYFASPGVDALTERDHIGSTKPYGHTAEKLNTFFFNVVTMDDGRNWSTEWVIDNPELFYNTR